MGKCTKCGTKFVGTAANPPKDGLCHFCERDELKADNSRLREALMLLLDNVDYSSGMCGVHEMVGAILPKEILVKANEAKRMSLWGVKGKGLV